MERKIKRSKHTKEETVNEEEEGEGGHKRIGGKEYLGIELLRIVHEEFPATRVLSC